MWGYRSLTADRWGGRAWARDGGGGRSRWLVSDYKKSQQQGPGMNILLLNIMQVSKYESAKDLAKSIFCNAYLHLTQFGPLNFWHEDTQVYYPWLEILFIENAKQIKNMLMILLTTMTRWIRANSIYQKNQQSRWFNEQFSRLRFQSKIQCENVWRIISIFLRFCLLSCSSCFNNNLIIMDCSLTSWSHFFPTFPKTFDSSDIHYIRTLFNNFTPPPFL